jgi:hypothetical protein
MLINCHNKIQNNIVCLFIGYISQHRHLCKTTRYTDECGNDGLLWDCGGLGLTNLPNGLPAVLHHLAIDISRNDFRVISYKLFSNVSLQLSSKVKAIYLRNNKLQLIKRRAFSQFRNLCVLTWVVADYRGLPWRRKLLLVSQMFNFSAYTVTAFKMADILIQR